MISDQPIYVVDTNILVDYPDIVPLVGEPAKKLQNPTVDLTNAHIVIPTAVIRELSSFKKEKTDRGKAARVVLKRIRALVEDRPESMSNIYNLKEVTKIRIGNKTFSVLPVHKDFRDSLPFYPSDQDMDGQIILTTLVAMFLRAGLPIDGSALMGNAMSLRIDDVTLLTNDNGLAIRARERGITTSRYEYKYPAPYTGRRDVYVPVELFNRFLKLHSISREEWEAFLPDEPRLIANEFIVMEPDCPDGYSREFSTNDMPYFSHIGRYDKNGDVILHLKYATSFPVPPKNAGQAIYAEALMNPDFPVVICTGPAGSGKTFMATVYGYMACRDGNYIGVTVVPCEDQGKLGALPGDLDEKMDPSVSPHKNALRNYLTKSDKKLRKELETFQKYGGKEEQNCSSKKNEAPKKYCGQEDEEVAKKGLKAKLKDRVDLIWENWFESVPIEHARGRDFSYEIALYDEFQDQNISQADTLIKRIGNEGKIVITGDIDQIHAPYLDVSNNGLVYASAQLFDHPLVAQVCFTKDEVVRHRIVKMIAERQERTNITE